MKLKSIFLAALAVLSIYSCEKEEKQSIFTFSVPNLTISGNGGEDSFKIKGDGDWKITTVADSWIKNITPISGNGNATITVELDKNETNETKTEIISINDQEFRIIQTPILEIGSIVGYWEDATGKFKFTFNEDLTCKADMSMMPAPLDATYKIDSPLIIITLDGGVVKIKVTVNSLEGDKMNASVNGQPLDLTRKVK